MTGFTVIPCSQIHYSNKHAQLQSGATSLKFGLSLHHHPYFVYVSSKKSGKTACVQLCAKISLAS